MLDGDAKLFGKSRFKAGDTISISSTFLTHGAGYQVDWNGKFNLSNR